MSGWRLWFQRAILARPWLTFVVMGASFFLFGASSINLFHLFNANLSFIVNQGWMGLVDGGLLQLLELLLNGYFSVAAFLIFKTCESSLVDNLRRGSKR